MKRGSDPEEKEKKLKKGQDVPERIVT